jgi:plasmid maintenance system killer protein
MSKILIDGEELKNLISKAQDFSYSDVYAKNTDKILAVLDKAIDLIEDAERSERFSVLEWHRNPKGIPNGKRCYLVKFKDKKGISMLWTDPRSFVDVEWWANLPE